jgi:small conductance mechanosensitive channel
MTNHIATLEQAKARIVQLSVDFGPKLITALIILAAGFFVARWVGGLVQRSLEKFKLEPPVRLLMLRLVRVLVFGLFLIMALQNLGVQLLPLIAGLGVAGAGIALAMQGVLGNLVAGLTIIFTKPFRVGEYVSMVGVEGRVETVDLFSTTLSHPDLSKVVVPNRKIVGEILHNYGNIRQVDILVSVAASTDLNAALAVVNDVLAANPRVLQKPQAVVGVAILANASVNIAIKPWVNVPDYGPATGELNKTIIEEFRARQIPFPIPRQDVHLLNPPAPKG